MHFVYVLFSEKDRKLYVGETEDVKRRVWQHQSGLAAATKNRLPVRLIYLEGYSNISEAKRRERYLKGGNGRESLKHQLNTTLKELGYLHGLDCSHRYTDIIDNIGE
jgi:putative endonuclease